MIRSTLERVGIDVGTGFGFATDETDIKAFDLKDLL
jgi:hypothetical protein